MSDRKQSPRFSAPSISLADLTAEYKRNNNSFDEYLKGLRPARHASQILPAKPTRPMSWPICPECHLAVTPRDDTGTDSMGNWLHRPRFPRRTG